MAVTDGPRNTRGSRLLTNGSLAVTIRKASRPISCGEPMSAVDCSSVGRNGLQSVVAMNQLKFAAASVGTVSKSKASLRTGANTKRYNLQAIWEVFEAYLSSK